MNESIDRAASGPAVSSSPLPLNSPEDEGRKNQSLRDRAATLTRNHVLYKGSSLYVSRNGLAAAEYQSPGTSIYLRKTHNLKNKNSIGDFM